MDNLEVDYDQKTIKRDLRASIKTELIDCITISKIVVGDKNKWDVAVFYRIHLATINDFYNEKIIIPCDSQREAERLLVDLHHQACENLFVLI